MNHISLLITSVSVLLHLVIQQDNRFTVPNMADRFHPDGGFLHTFKEFLRSEFCQILIINNEGIDCTSFICLFPPFLGSGLSRSLVPRIKTVFRSPLPSLSHAPGILLPRLAPV